MEKDLKYYLQAFHFRKWYFIIPAVLIALGTAVVAVKMPPVYQSSATILIEEQQIPPEYVRSTVTGFADQHIQIINQQILSSTKLLEIIKQLNLFADSRKTKTQEELVESMRRNIKLETISAEVNDKHSGSKMTIAFKISYRGGNPHTVQKVAGTLASVYLEQNLKYREAQAKTTTVFLEAELRQIKEQIANLGQRISEYKIAHEGMLPELQQFNLAQAERLEHELKQIDNSIRAAENQKIYLEGLLSSQQGGSGDKNIPDPPSVRLRAMEEQLSLLRAKFSEDHPDVQKAKREKEQFEKYLKSRGAGDPQRQEKLVQLQAELAEKQGRYSEQHPEIRRLKSEINRLTEGAGANPLLSAPDLANPAQVNLLTQIQTNANEIALLKQQRRDVQARLQVFRHRLEQAPKVEQEYLALQRDYQNAHAKHQDVMNKLMEARISEGMEEHQKGQRFTLIDPAQLPEQPIKPNRPMILLAGLVFAVVAGGAVMLGAEVQDHSVKTPEELAWLTEMSPLGIIGTIETPGGLARKKRRRQLLWLAAAGSVPLLIVIVHLFVFDLYILAAKLGRWAG